MTAPHTSAHRPCANPACLAQLPDQGRSYCSSACAARMNNHRRSLRRLLAYWRAPHRCERAACNVEIPWDRRRNRYCSRSCAALDRSPTPSRTRECDGCGAPTSNERFCSTTCAQDTRRRELDAAIERSNGRGFEHRTLRGYLLRRANGCELCATTTWTGQPVPLAMDHIDGDPTNDHLDNLRLICPNCDALLPTYKSRNRGNGRASRRERYHAGLSW